MHSLEGPSVLFVNADAINADAAGADAADADAVDVDAGEAADADAAEAAPHVAPPAVAAAATAAAEPAEDSGSERDLNEEEDVVNMILDSFPEKELKYLARGRGPRPGPRTRNLGPGTLIRWPVLPGSPGTLQFSYKP